MHEAAFANAAITSQWVVLKLPLRDYSLWHEAMLQRKESPFVTGEKPTLKDIIEAVLICAHTKAESEKPDYLLWLKSRIWARRIRKENFPLAIADFCNYRAAGSTEPPTAEMPTPGQPQRPPGAPFLIRLVQFLILKMGMTESAAWDYPFGLAKWHYAAFYESEQGIRVKNAHEFEFDRYCEEQDAKQAAETNAKGGQCPA